MADATDILAAAGKYRVEYAVDETGKMPAKDFIKDHPASKARLLAIFAHFAQSGPQAISHDMFCQERDDIHAFRCKEKQLRLRLPCFRYGDCWYITHGFVKPPKSKWDEQEFTRANKIKDYVISQTKPQKKN